MGYKVIYISQAEHLHLYLDNLKVEKENTDILIPIADIQILVIDNYKAYLTVPLMNKLSEKNVCPFFVVLIIFQRHIYYQ